MSGAFGGLVNYYDDFVPNCLPLADGGRRTKRSAQQLAKKHGFPLVKIGLVTFIDPVIAAERLREAQLAERAPRPRGRPRQYRGGSSAADAPAPLVAAPHTK